MLAAALAPLLAPALGSAQDLDHALKADGEATGDKAIGPGAVPPPAEPLFRSLEDAFIDLKLQAVPSDEQAWPEGFGTERIPPTNNNCNFATTITGLTTVNFDLTEATTDGLPHFLCTAFGQNQIEKDVWFRWTAPNTAQFDIETCGLTTLDTRIAVYNPPSSCPAPESFLIGCNDDACGSQSRVRFSAVAGVQYFIRVGVYPGRPGGPGQLRIAFSPGQTICSIPGTSCQTRDGSNAYESTFVRVLDDFRTTAAGGSVSGVCWWGTYFNGTADCRGQFPDRFRVRYYRYSGGAPTFLVAEFTQSSAILAVTGPLATGNSVLGGLPEYAYTATHPPVSLSPNTCYFVEISNELPGNNECGWYWERASTGNGIGRQGEEIIPSDLAFCLNIPLNASTICQTSAPPANDECGNATRVFCNQTNEVTNLFATENVTDPEFACRGGGPARGFGTLWFRFTPSSTTAEVTTCNFIFGDSILGVYSGTCGNLVPIGCGEDDCGFRSRVRLTGLSTTTQYYVQVAAYSETAQGPYDLQVFCPAAPTPVNDTCAGALTISLNASGAGSATGDTTGALIDDEAPACGFSALTAGSVWYRVVGNGRRMTAALCLTSAFDTKLNVYCGACPDLVCIGTDDDSCGSGAVGGPSQLSWCSTLGQSYYIMVYGFDGDTGLFNLQITSEATACSGAISCAPCALTCPPGAVPEGEACGTSVNAGCNEFPENFQLLQPGQVVCGTAYAIGTTRDIDWFRFTIPFRSRVTWAVQSETPVEAYILDTVCGPAPGVLASALIARCGSANAVAILDPGDYRLFLGGITNPAPCSTSNDYLAQLIVEPLGACCTASDCRSLTALECSGISGTYAGAGTPCPTSYTQSACANPLQNIASTGNALTLGPDAGQSVAIGFPFRFYGVDYQSVGVSSNGYVAFGSTDLTNPGNVTIPNAAQPNAFAAPLWTDLAPDQGGSVRYQLLGVAPNRVFVVQWTNVPRAFTIDANTFQVLLFETSNCLEFRYGQFTPSAQGGGYTVGVENQAGSAGTTVNAATLVNGSCVRLCPVTTPGGCTPPPPACPGNANGDGTVNFNDITAVLSNFGRPGPVGDADGNGSVTFADIASVLSNFGRLCTPPPCPGDANNDRTVTFADLTACLTNWSSAGPLGDANRDGTVNFADITNVLTNFNTSCP